MPHIRINSKWIKDLNVRPEIIKTLEENIGSKISDISHSNFLLDISSQAWETKENINKWHYIKLKSFCTAKENINKIKRQSTEWENIFLDTPDKDLISKISNELSDSIPKYQTPQLKIWTKDLNRHLSKEDIQMANSHIKRGSTSLIFRKMQIKTAMKYYFKPTRMTINEKMNTKKCWSGCRANWNPHTPLVRT